MFGTKKQHALWKALGSQRAWLYLGYTSEMHIFEGDESIMEIAILDDDKTCVPSIPIERIPKDVKAKFNKCGYIFKEYDDLTREEKEELGYEEI